MLYDNTLCSNRFFTYLAFSQCLYFSITHTVFVAKISDVIHCANFRAPPSTPLMPLHPMFDCFLPKSLWIVWWVDDWCYREINCLRTNSGFPLPGTTSRACQTSTKLSTTTTTIVLAANTSAVFLRTCHDHYQKPKRAVFPTQPN